MAITKAKETQLTRILVNYSPPVINFEYRIKASDREGGGVSEMKKNDEDKFQTKKVRLKAKYLSQKPCDIELIAFQLQDEFPQFFCGDEDNIIIFDNLKSLLRKLCNHVQNDFFLSIDHHNKIVEENKDLNKISEEANLIKAKKAMELTYNSNRIKPNSKGYQYDVRVDFEGDTISINSWDNN